MRKGKLSRNTIAVGIVVIDALRSKCPLQKADIVSKGGEIKGARSKLPTTLAKYSIPGFLKEATTRQVHQDGQRLLEELRFGKLFQHLTLTEREAVLRDLIDILIGEAMAWLARQHLKVVCNRDAAPGVWVGEILDQARGRSGGRVEQHLVGAKLSRAHPNVTIPSRPGAAADAQAGHAGDFEVATTVYHVTAAPGDDVIHKCDANAREGLHPVLLVPARDKVRAEVLADHLGMGHRMTVLAIEDFLSVNILEMSKGERSNFIGTLRGIVVEYNRRVEEAETDKSLKIEVR